MSIPFTQYLRPDGRKQPVLIDMDDETEQLSKQLIKEGCFFEIELLQTAIVAMYCYQNDEENLVSMRLCKNNKQVPITVKDMIEEAHRIVFKEE